MENEQLQKTEAMDRTIELGSGLVSTQYGNIYILTGGCPAQGASSCAWD